MECWTNDCIASVYPETMFLDVILRSKATKNLLVSVAAEILRGVYPELVEGPRMTLGSLGMDPSDLTDSTDSTDSTGSTENL